MENLAIAEGIVIGEDLSIAQELATAKTYFETQLHRNHKLKYSPTIDNGLVFLFHSF
jgi:hypothetical protein